MKFALISAALLISTQAYAEDKFIWALMVSSNGANFVGQYNEGEMCQKAKKFIVKAEKSAKVACVPVLQQ